MKKILFISLCLTLSACSWLANPEVISIKNPKPGQEIVVEDIPELPSNRAKIKPNNLSRYHD